MIENDNVIKTYNVKMSFLTNNKDVNRVILSKLESQDLRNVLTVNKTTNKYNNDILWLNYQMKDLDFNLMRTVIKRSWKDFSLLLIRYLDLAKGDYDTAMKLAAKGGHRDLVDFFISKGADFWNKGADNWNRAMYYAAQGGHRDLVDFFISQGANNRDLGMEGAALGGHRDLVDFFISKGDNSWNYGMEGAARGGHRKLVDFFISKGADDWRYAWCNRRRST